MRTQVAIIGAGPAGTLLSHLLDRDGIESVVLERQSRAYVLGRIRAGVLEWGTVELLRNVGLGERMDAEGHVHDTINIAWRGAEILTMNTANQVAKQMMAYGQTNIQEDLYAAHDAAGGTIIDEAEDVMAHDITSDSPYVTFSKNGVTERLECDFVAGCDGFHGVTRTLIPRSVVQKYEKVYPFGWLGILSETKPLPIILYANHERGFALCSMRNPQLSRYYVQCPLEDRVEDWSDDRFWSELFARIPPDQQAQIETGPSIEKSIAPLRSFVAEPLRHGALFLAGDAAHIVPPTGAKGLNLWSSFRAAPPQRRSRLYRELVDQRLAAAIGGACVATEDPYLFMVSVTAATGQESKIVEDATLQVLDTAAASGITAQELDRATRQLRARMVFENDSVTNLGHQLGYFSTVTNLDTYAALPDRIGAVTTDDVARVARTYLTESNRTVGWFEPVSDS